MAILFAGPVAALTDEEAQKIICDLWGGNVENAYGIYEVMVSDHMSDPIGQTREVMEYSSFEPGSAGHIMLSMALTGIETGLPVDQTKASVVSTCNQFSPDAVDPANAYIPLSQLDP